MNVDVVYLVAGLSLLVAVVLPVLLSRVALSAPIVLVLLGAGIGFVPALDGGRLDLVEHRAVVEHLAELCVIVALMGVGLALDRPLRWRSRTSWRAWGPTWRLLLLAMPACIAGTALLGWWVMGLAPASALLLGAVLAPTDPVLAADVQVEGPTTSAQTPTDDPDGIDESDEVRFALTSEAGLNDALAFPFVYAAIYLASRGDVGDWIAGWVGMELLVKTLVGVAVGAAGGWVLGRLAFSAPARSMRLAERGEPLLALAATLAVYGLAEVAHGWGFLAVFVAALTLRAQERQHEYHRQMHELVERLELLLTLLILLMLGAALADGLLGGLDWRGVVVGSALLLVVRPVTAWCALGHSGVADADGNGGLGPRERRVTAFFGVRGIGSIYYIAYALGQAHFPEGERLWATVGFTVLASVLLHGLAATPVMRRLAAVRQASPPGGRSVPRLR